MELMILRFVLVVLVCVGSPTWTLTVDEFAISTMQYDEHNPYIDQGTVVWQMLQ
jgi:hypothetical protein